MSEDLIRRSDVIKFLNDYLGDCYRVSRRKYEKTMLDAISMDFEAVITNIPAVEPKHGGWIPCSVKLPHAEKREYWICTNIGYQYQCRWTNVNHFWNDLTTDWHWHIMDIPQHTEVVAWMPLPESYKEK